MIIIENNETRSLASNLNISEGIYDLTNKIHTKTHRNKNKIKCISKIEDLYEDIDISILHRSITDIKEEPDNVKYVVL